jgi:hypothetical protein
MKHEQEVRVMTYARCSECGHVIQVENVNNDVMMMWQGTHCGLAQAYFADEDIFETSTISSKRKSTAIAPRS